MIDPLSLGIGIVIGAVVGIGGSVWFVKRKLQQMQNSMFGPMDGMMQDSSTQQDQPDMEAVMGYPMDMMEIQMPMNWNLMPMRSTRKCKNRDV